MAQDNLRHAQYGADGIQVDDPQALFPSVVAPQQAFAGNVKTLTRELTLTVSVLCQLPNGTYVTTTRLPEAEGFYGSQLGLATGSLSSLTNVGQLNTRTSGLKTSAGATITNGTIIGAWALPDNNVLFAVSSNGGATTSKAYLYYAKNTAGTLTVGSNAPNHDNGNAVVDIGEKAGVQPTNIRTLHSRSICVAIIAGSPVVLLNEYNVAFGRVPGSTNDQVYVRRSDDLGKTWSIFLTFNTNGSTSQVRHGHGVVQDKLTGDVYFLFGDDPTSGILRWNGTASAPPANTDLPAFNFYDGWASLARTDGRTDDYRTGDLIFIGDCGAYLTDRAGSRSFWKSTTTSRVDVFSAVKGEEVDLSDGRDPLIGLAVPGAGGFWATMWDNQVTPTVRGFTFFSTPDGKSWKKIGELQDVGTTGATGVLFNMFMSKENLIVVSLISGSSKLINNTNTYGGTVVFNAEKLFDGTFKNLSA